MKKCTKEQRPALKGSIGDRSPSQTTFDLLKSEDINRIYCSSFSNVDLQKTVSQINQMKLSSTFSVDTFVFFDLVLFSNSKYSIEKNDPELSIKGFEKPPYLQTHLPASQRLATSWMLYSFLLATLFQLYCDRTWKSKLFYLFL